MLYLNAVYIGPAFSRRIKAPRSACWEEVVSAFVRPASQRTWQARRELKLYPHIIAAKLYKH